jgi:ABC-2 type transport system ATP-binding protein
MIKIDGYTKAYDEAKAVDNLSLEVKPGEVFGLLGPNGAGKTSTIKAMAGLLEPSGGKILIGGFDIVEQGIDAKRLLGYVPDEPFLYERLTAREFLEFVCGLWDMDEQKANENIEKYLEYFGLSDVADDFLQSYSRGMKQKINIIHALAHEPKVLILDEPLNALDPKSAKNTKDLLTKFADSGGTVFMATHFLDTAERFCSRVGIMNKGKLVAEGSLDELKIKACKEAGSLEDIFLILTETADEPQVLSESNL